MMKRDKVVFENEKFEVTGYDIWMTGYKDELYNLECIIAVSYYVDTGLAHEFRHWICDRTTKRKERAMIVYF